MAIGMVKKIILYSKKIALFLAVALAITVFYLFRPLPPVTLQKTRVSLPEVPINPLCRDIVQKHVPPTGRVIVFFHGYTNCPKQFEELGNQFYRAGFSVYIPRLPRHGYLDRLTSDTENLTPEELVR